MNKFYARFLSTTLALISVPVMAIEQRMKIVYGEDNRVEIFETSKEIQKLASSTAGMVNNSKLLSLGKLMMLPPSTLKDDMGVCANERFADQSSAAMCSGFLVGPDLLVTAGHCINSAEDCSDVSWVFDYAVKKETGRANVVVSKEKVYKCKKVLESKLDVVTMQDYSLIQLERVVGDRAPLKYRTADKVETNADIFVIGHPSGLPSKYAGGASVLENNTKHFFQANLDTFGGNSGSAVFNERTNEVEGILVRGARDYNYNYFNNCNMVNTVPNEIANFDILGESVSRITDINSLKYRNAYLNAARNGDLETVKFLLDEVKIFDIYDNDLNSALHLATAYNQVHVVAYLLEKMVEIDRQNYMGNTALHLAMMNGNVEIAKMLLKSGASIAIRNKAGKTVLDTPSFIERRIREILKVYPEVK